MTETFLMVVMVSSVVSAIVSLVTVLMLKKPRMSVNLVLLTAFSGVAIFGAVGAIVVGLSRGSMSIVVFGCLSVFVVSLFSIFFLINDRKLAVG